MRNNPDHGTKLEYQTLFIEQARMEKIKRFFAAKKTKVYKHFCIQPYHSNFAKKHVNEYVSALDNFLQMKRCLVKEFTADGVWGEEVDNNTSISFEVFYDTLSKWAINQTELDYANFAAGDIEKEKKGSADFKKLTERLI
jgi:hypothetical protein